MHSSNTTNPATEIDWRRWYEGKTFTQDWTTRKLETWTRVLAPLRHESVDVLEVGSFEGRSAVAFLEYLPNSTLTAVDMFDRPDVEARFDDNLAPYAGRVTKIRSRAFPALDLMLSERRKFQVIYLDACKRRDDSFVLSTLAWPLLAKGGVLIWDDVRWRPELPEEARPQAAIRLFSYVYGSCLDVLHDGTQLIVTKTSDWPLTTLPMRLWPVRHNLGRKVRKKAAKFFQRHFRLRLQESADRGSVEKARRGNG